MPWYQVASFIVGALIWGGGAAVFIVMTFH